MCIFQIGLASAEEGGPVLGVLSQTADDISLYSILTDIMPEESMGLLDETGVYLCCLSVRGKPVAQRDAPLSDYAGGPISVYPAKLQGEAAEHFRSTPVFGAALRQGVRVVDSRSGVHTLLYAGKKTQLTMCASREGVHLIVRPYASERVLMHLYYYLGYDVEPTCK